MAYNGVVAQVSASAADSGLRRSPPRRCKYGSCSRSSTENGSGRCTPVLVVVALGVYSQ